jgi:PhnB protein
MANINPYLLFDGTCEAAFNFYKSVFGGEFPFMGRFKDMPPSGDCPPPSGEAGERIMHVSLRVGDTWLMGSDCMPDMPNFNFTPGNNFSVSINAGSKEEADRLFNGLSAGGQVTMPMEMSFWGAYFGMFVDKFGVAWMVNFDTDESKK